MVRGSRLTKQVKRGKLRENSQHLAEELILKQQESLKEALKLLKLKIKKPKSIASPIK